MNSSPAMMISSLDSPRFGWQYTPGLGWRGPRGGTGFGPVQGFGRSFAQKRLCEGRGSLPPQAKVSILLDKVQTPRKELAR